MSKRITFTDEEFEELGYLVECMIDTRKQARNKEYCLILNSLIRKLKLDYPEFTAADWQDDDSPQAEKPFRARKRVT